MFNFKTASKELLKVEYDRIAAEMGDNKFFTKKELAHLPSILMDGEQVLAFASGMMDGKTWLISLTDKRVIFLDKGMFTGLSQTTIDLEKINSISGSTGLLMGEISIETGASTKKIGSVLKKVVTPFTNKVRDAVEAQKKMAAKATAPQVHASPDDVTAKLERLAGLLEKGILTKDEFSAQKAKLLAL